MIGPVSPSRPVDVLRQSSDQIRRAAAVLAEITEETTAERLERYGLAPAAPSSGPDDDQAAREATIQQAQRSFVAGLRGRAGRRRREAPDQSET